MFIRLLIVFMFAVPAFAETNFCAEVLTTPQNRAFVSGYMTPRFQKLEDSFLIQFPLFVRHHRDLNVEKVTLVKLPRLQDGLPEYHVLLEPSQAIEATDRLSLYEYTQTATDVQVRIPLGDAVVSFDAFDDGNWVRQRFRFEQRPEGLVIKQIENVTVKSAEELAPLIEASEKIEDFAEEPEAPKKRAAAAASTRASSSPRYFAKITREDLEAKIEAAFKAGKKKGSPAFDEVDSIDASPGVLASLTATVRKDLSKLDFDIENADHQQAFGHSRGMADLIGYQTLPNGMTYLGVNAGGDWEIPVYFIIYWDGKQLRAYVPTEGNPWNTDTRQAYGNDEEADAANIAKRFGPKATLEELDFDPAKIRADIENRIKPAKKK